MKLKVKDRLSYKCDDCGGLRKHVDMFDESICYNCWEKKQ